MIFTIFFTYGNDNKTLYMDSLYEIQRVFFLIMVYSDATNECRYVYAVYNKKFGEKFSKNNYINVIVDMNNAYVLLTPNISKWK